MAKNKPAEKKLNKKQPTAGKLVRRLVGLMWTVFLLPFIFIFSMLIWANTGDMPTLDELENPQMNLASEVYSADNELLGKYFKENRSNVRFAELPQALVDCLVATEDERFFTHTGIDFRALGRAVSGGGGSGGGSTITQQLAKMLFNEQGVKGFNRIRQKFKEWIIAAQIEQKFSKREIITMYFNKFDFLHNAVGIKSAARVYFNTTPDSLTIEQCAMLVGMAKNPSLFNPKSHPDAALKRREVVLKQLLKNCNNGNEYIKTKFTKADYEKYRKMPLGIKYTKVDHVDGLAPYFREELRKKLTAILNEKDADGNLKIHKKNGKAYDVYSDGLKIYTTIDSRMQKYGEWAVREYLRTELQAKFDKDNKSSKKAPFAYDVHDTTIAKLMTKARHQSKRYKMYTGQICGYCEKPKYYIKTTFEGGKPFYYCIDCKHRQPGLNDSEMLKMFDRKVEMKVFSWRKPGQEFDTIMSPNDSIKYYMKFVQAALISIDPHTGFIKAWVGGPDYRYFKYDHVNGRRQVGSTFKPFVYAAAFFNDIYTPCDEIPDIEHCIEVPFTAKSTKSWCPKNEGGYTGAPMPLYYALPQSMNNITAAIIKVVKAPNVIRLVENMGMPKGYLPPVPSICLGSCELSPYEMTGAQATFANKGIFIKPIMFTRIEDKNGNVIYDVEPETNEAMDEESAYTMCMVMKGATSGVMHPYLKSKRGGPLVGGTAAGIRSSAYKWGGLKYPIAGKTGTTNKNTDGWFMGLTPDLVTGVWTGADNNAVHWRYTNDGQGAKTALPIFGYYMKKIYADHKLKISTGDFEAPEGFTLFDCKDFQGQNSELWKQIDLKEVEESSDFEGDHNEEEDDEKMFDQPK